MTDVTFDDAVMGEEIFGPILPVLTWNSLDEAIAQVESRPHPAGPLLLYLQQRQPQAGVVPLPVRRRLHQRHHHPSGHQRHALRRRGGERGMGGYHGKAGFEEFSHTRSIVDKKTWIDLPMRYQPYTGLKDRMIRMFLR